ncbi:MAG: MerR family DNA-binding transcriptional regulator [Proteobacteria bacterium]|nr:MAG: MerR family DNA-binding transcriptional regulator [Pseudomonadota bacterium]
MKFAEVAKAADVAIDAVRFYEWEGLVPQTARWPAGHRDYSSATILDL